MLALRRFSVLLVFSAVAVPEAAASTSQRPNVLVIVTDDQRQGTLSVMPQTRDWFIQRGVRYPNGYVTTPMCCPSRASIFTGRYAHNHDVHTNWEAGALDQASTVQRYLREAGYLTALAGKFLNKWDVSVPPSFFDRWAMYSPPLTGDGYYDNEFNVDGNITTIGSYATNFLRQRSVGFLEDFEEQDDVPWFLYVAPYAPHFPARAAARYRQAPVGGWDGNPATAERDLSDKPSWIQARTSDLEDGQQRRRKQLRALMSVDELVGALRDALADLGERRDTLAIFISDNGYLWGEHGWSGKSVPYPQATDVPLFARWPGHLAPGQGDTRSVANVDLAPTILDAAGITPDPRYPMDGRSLLGSEARTHTFMEWFRAPDTPVRQDWASVRTADVQYTEYYDAHGQIAFREYYDLSEDPWQLNNLLGDGAPENDPPDAELTQLSLQLMEDRSCVGATGPGSCP